MTTEKALIEAQRQLAVYMKLLDVARKKRGLGSANYLYAQQEIEKWQGIADGLKPPENQDTSESENE